MSVLDAVQNVLTKGIDAAASVKLAQLQVHDPTYNTVGPYGSGGKAGQGAFGGVSNAHGAVPPVVWIGGAVLIAALFLLPRRR